MAESTSEEYRRRPLGCGSQIEAHFGLPADYNALPLAI